MAGVPYAQVRDEYSELWSTMKIPAASLPAVEKRARAIATGKPRYDQVSNATGVPWFVVGIIHEMEGSLDFDTHLHNGDPLSDRTVQVPAGRPPTGNPPFDWEDSAIDALSMKHLEEVTLWSIERIAFQLEAYNGWGYRTRDTGVNTPYLWSFTNQYKKGKFVRDGVFDREAVSRQVGAMALLRGLIDKNGITVPAERDVPTPPAPPRPTNVNLVNSPYPGNVIRLNHANPAVVTLIQRRLNQLGCSSKVDPTGKIIPLEEDGDFGPLTEAGVRLFQTRSFDAGGQPLSADGVVGPKTWGALFSGAPAPPPPPPPPPPHDLLRRVIDVARAEEGAGVREQPIGSNRGPRVDEYLRAAGLDPTRGNYAWCAAFLVFCFDQAARAVGVQSPLPRTAGVHDMWQRAGRAGFRRIAHDVAVGDPSQIQAGHLFFIDTGNGHGHVGLVTAQANGMIDTIEGNTNELGGREGIGVFARQRPVRHATLGYVEFAPR